MSTKTYIKTCTKSPLPFLVVLAISTMEGRLLFFLCPEYAKWTPRRASICISRYFKPRPQSGRSRRRFSCTRLQTRRRCPRRGTRRTYAGSCQTEKWHGKHRRCVLPAGIWRKLSGVPAADLELGCGSGYILGCRADINTSNSKYKKE